MISNIRRGIKSKIIVSLILCIFLLGSIPTTSAASYSYNWVDSTRTATINRHTLLSTNPLLDIKQVSVKEGLTTFEEVVEITSYVDYKLTGRDLKWLWTKHRGQHGISLSELYILKNGQFNPFSPKDKTIHSGQTYTIKTILHKKAETGDFSIHLTPEIAGVTIKELTWWNSSWLYKIESVLTDVPLGGYQYNLTVHSASGTNNQTDVFLNGLNATNFADIRFVLDDITELAYWIENITIDPIEVWINVTDNGTVGLYYGNDDVSSTSNVTKTFLFGDDFPGSSIDTNKWEGDTAQAQVSGGIMHFPGGTASYEYLNTITNFTSPVVVEARHKWSLDHQMQWGFYHSTDANNYIVAFINSDPLNRIVTLKAGATANTTTNWVQDTYRNVKIIWDKDTPQVRWYEDGVEKTGSPFTTAANIPIVDLPVGMYVSSTNTDEHWFDWVFVRKYISPEPAWGVWSVQQYKPLELDSILQYNAQRKLTRTSEGYLYRVYTKFDGSYYRVYYGKSMDDGNNWVETVLTDAGINNTHPSIAGDSEDTLWIIYSRECSGIKYRKFEGLSWQAEQTISTDSGEVPVIAVDSGDSIHASWMANLSTYQIRYWNGTNTTNVTSGSNNSKYPSLAIDSNNYLHLAYQKWNSTSNTTNIKYQKYTDSWQSVYNVTLGETYSQQYPCIVIDLSDYVHVTWQAFDNKIKYKKYTTSWQATEEVCDGGIYGQYNPSVSVYATNYVYVTWFGLTAGYPDYYIIREKHWSGGWSGISDILHPAGKNVTYPNSISALYPKICGDCYLNIPLTGFSFVYDEDDGTIKYYNASTWRCPDDYVITITARDSETNQNILNFTVDFSAGETKTTDSGVVKYSCLESGYYEITISSNEYHSAQQSVVLDQSKAIIVYLIPISETVYVLPKAQEVRFFVQDMYGNPKENVNVNVTTIETTMGSWDWLMDFFGFENATAIQNATMNGTTDSAGSISFLMVETIKYNLHFKNTTQDIDINLTIYPKSDRYTVIVGRKPFYYVEPQLFGEEIVWNFTMEKVDGTDAWLNFTYNDTLGETTSGSYYVYMVNETTGIEKINMSNRTYYCSTPLYNMSSVWSYSCLVSDYRGNTYILGFNATHTTAGEFKEAVSVFFRYNHPLIQFAGWDEHPGYYQFLSICLLVFFSLLFTGVTIKVGAALLPLIGWILFGIGWFSPTDNLVTGAILLGIATAIGISVFITTTGREKNLAS